MRSANLTWGVNWQRVLKQKGVK